MKPEQRQYEAAINQVEESTSAIDSETANLQTRIQALSRRRHIVAAKEAIKNAKIHVDSFTQMTERRIEEMRSSCQSLMRSANEEASEQINRMNRCLEDLIEQLGEKAKKDARIRASRKAARTRR